MGDSKPAESSDVKLSVKNIFPEIPDNLANLVGRITIRSSALERVLMTAICRVEEVKAVDPAYFDFSAFLCDLKERHLTLGQLVNEAASRLGKYGFDWLDIPAMRKLTSDRNAIHDALMQDSNGNLIWQASGSRPHRPVDYQTLAGLLDRVESTLLRINKESLELKRRDKREG